ncbi:hypothetical protein JHK87_015164 [Glycine soja]|nr:hypothetical protein JHK87_015164 [Glycine soja]
MCFPWQFYIYWEANQHYWTCMFLTFLSGSCTSLASVSLYLPQYFFWWLKKQNLGHDHGSNTSLVCIRSFQTCLVN